MSTASPRFYHFFTFAPKGKHTCVVCTGTACYVKGADRLLAAIEGSLGTVAGKTTADGQVSLMTARCLGACGLAPLVVYDGEVAGSQSPESALGRLKGWTSRWISMICDAIAETERSARKPVRIRCCAAAGCLPLGSVKIKEGLDAAVAAGRSG